MALSGPSETSAMWLLSGKADLEHTTLERAAPAAPFRIQRQAVGYLVPEFFGVGERRRKFQVVA